MLNTRQLQEEYKNTKKIKNNIEKRKHFYELPPIQSRLAPALGKPKSSFTHGDGAEEYDDVRAGFYSENTKRRNQEDLQGDHQSLHSRSPGRKQPGSKRELSA